MKPKKTESSEHVIPTRKEFADMISLMVIKAYNDDVITYRELDRIMESTMSVYNTKTPSDEKDNQSL